MDKYINKVPYTPGIFDQYLSDPNLDHWCESFPKLMWGLSFEMDSGESFKHYAENSTLTLKPAVSRRQEFRKNLYLLEHADKQIVGNYLFSYWRYLTHWCYGYDEYDVDYIFRIIHLLEQKLSS